MTSQHDAGAAHKMVLTAMRKPEGIRIVGEKLFFSLDGSCRLDKHDTCATSSYTPGHPSSSSCGVGQEDEGGVGGSRTSVVLVQATKRVEREEEFSPTMGIPSCFLMGVSAICVRCRRHVATSCGQFRVRTDLVQCDIFTVQYKLFNFGVNKFISGVNPYNLSVNINPNGVI